MVVKLKDLLFEGLDRKEMQSVVDRVYPLIAKNLGRAKRGTPKVEFHTNIYARLSGDQQATGEAKPHAEYDWDKNKIYLYASAISNVEQIIRSLLHEHTHTRQNRKKFRDGYESGKYTYANHPYELAAVKAEKRWKNYLRYLK